jgi:hypothetical protein
MLTSSLIEAEAKRIAAMLQLDCNCVCAHDVDTDKLYFQATTTSGKYCRFRIEPNDLETPIDDFAENKLLSALHSLKFINEYKK